MTSTCVNVYMYSDAFIWYDIHVCKNARERTNTALSKKIHTAPSIYKFMYSHSCMYIIYTHIHIDMYIHMDTYIHTYMYIHARKTRTAPHWRWFWISCTYMCVCIWYIYACICIYTCAKTALTNEACTMPHVTLVSNLFYLHMSMYIIYLHMYIYVYAYANTALPTPTWRWCRISCAYMCVCI